MLLVTSLGITQYQSQGKQMMSSLRDFSKLPLRVYSEDLIIEIPEEERYSLRAVDGWEEFQEHTKEFTPTSYLYDAQRFSHKVYAMLDAFESRHRYVVWLDIDIVFKKRFTANFFKKLLKGHMCAYLGRGTTYTETGCLIFDTWHKDFEEFKKRFRSMYDDKIIFMCPIYIDCLAFDYSRQELDAHDLTPQAQGMVDVFSMSPLNDIMEHNKGQGHGRYK